MQLSTQRLLLRTWKAEDRVAFAAMNSDARVMEHFPALLTSAQSDALAQRIELALCESGYGLWALEVPGVAEFIGFAGLSVPRQALPCMPCVEVGWRLAQPYWGYGYASEAARASLEFAFERAGLEEVVSFTALGNHRSRAVMERIGMGNSGEDFDHPAVPSGHAARRHCLYRISRNHWLRSGERAIVTIS